MEARLSDGDANLGSRWSNVPGPLSERAESRTPAVGSGTAVQSGVLEHAGTFNSRFFFFGISSVSPGRGAAASRAASANK